MESRIAAIDEHQVLLEDGRAFAASRVVLATGVQPNKRLAERSGLACGRGILVDRQLATAQPGSAPSASAVKSTVRPGAGGAVSAPGGGAGGPPVRDPGEDFSWQDSGTRLKVTGIELFSAGELRADEQDDVYTSWDPLDRHYRRLLLRDGKLRGVLLLGDCSSAAPSPLCWGRMRRRRQSGSSIPLQRCSRALRDKLR
jgi:nitrite reductase (NADH) large subunit